MNKKLKEVLIELSVAIAAGYIVVCLTTQSAKEAPSPVKQEPHLIMVHVPSRMQLDLVATEVSKPQTEELRCADA